MRWTTEQQAAIDHKGQNLLLSAAAGSGKTAVLTERVGKLFAETGNPERLLVVTFTRKAADEMKQKIIRSLGKKYEADPSDVNIAKAYRTIDLADISTIDSFCIRLVRENAAAAGVSPAFRIASDSEEKIIAAKAMLMTLDALHGKGGEDFDRLCELYCSDRDDSDIETLIRRIYNFSASSPFPKEKRHEMLAMFDGEGKISESVWGRAILENTRITAEHARNLYSKALRIYGLPRDDTGDKAYFLWAEYDLCVRIEELSVPGIGDAEWDELRELLLSLKKKEYTKFNLDYAKHGFDSKSTTKITIKALRDSAKEALIGITVFPSGAENKKDLETLRPLAKVLFDAADMYGDFLTGLKSAANVMTFSDTLHAAIALIADREGNPTALGKEYRSRYDEIMIDEYQDTSEAQDMLFGALSDGGNLFMVGDAKQSIYKFRGTTPSVFTGKADAYKHGNGGRALTLTKNFRSDRDIIDNVNFIFNQIIRPEVGNIDYTQEQLVHNDERKELTGTPGFELCLFDRKDAEPGAVTAYIRDHLGEVFAYGDNGEPKTACYGDFCLLFRKKTRMEEFAEALGKAGIPYVSDSDSELLDNHEIMVLCAILDVIDNPLNDVPLTAAMYSPVFGFTVDELAEIRMTNAYAPLWQNLREYAKQNEKAAGFIGTISGLRDLSVCTGLQDFIRKVVSELDFLEIASCIHGCRYAKDNIAAFIRLAGEYDGSADRDIHGFMRFLTTVREGRCEIKSSVPSGRADSVRIMTIHKSKGLEFPYVIICDSPYYDNADEKKLPIRLNGTAGAGMNIRDKKTYGKYDTVSSLGVSLTEEKENAAENIRLLYVALTRAVNRLVVCLPGLHQSNGINRFAATTNACFVLGHDTMLDEYTILNNSLHGKILEYALARHPRLSLMEEKAAETSTGKSTFVCCAEKLVTDAKAAESYFVPEETENGETEEPCAPPYEETEAGTAAIAEKADYVYPYLCFEGILAKRSASRSNREFNTQYIGASRPAFMNDGRLTPAAKGTAYHRFLQLCDFARLAEDPEAERYRVRSMGKLSDDEMDIIDTDKLYAFVTSETGRAAIGADEIYKELPFNIFMKASEIYDDCPPEAADEDILVQGMADLVFVKDGKAVIVDYKTDRVSDAEDLKARYGRQLAIYRRAVGEILGIPVSDTLLYSLPLNTPVSV